MLTWQLYTVAICDVYLVDKCLQSNPWHKYKQKEQYKYHHWHKKLCTQLYIKGLYHASNLMEKLHFFY